MSNFNHKLLIERLKTIDLFEARRYEKLTGEPQCIAATGIIRHLRACRRMEVDPDIRAVREIISDALEGNRFYPESVSTYPVSPWFRRSV